MKFRDVVHELKKVSSVERAKNLSRYFKTSKGQYGCGDVFIGITVPDQRKVAKESTSLSLSETRKLLKSKIHEHRLTALLILVDKFNKEGSVAQKQIVDLYLKNTKYINNWDLVDLSAPNIVGRYLFDKPRQILYKLAKSKNLWEKRISIISTMYFIKQGDFKDTLAISGLLLTDKHDLIHKAVGWMLREVGKKNEKILTKFIDDNFKNMSRTTLRYSIEKFSETKRQKYLNKI